MKPEQRAHEPDHPLPTQQHSSMVCNSRLLAYKTCDERDFHIRAARRAYRAGSAAACPVSATTVLPGPW